MFESTPVTTFFEPFGCQSACKFDPRIASSEDVTFA